MEQTKSLTLRPSKIKFNLKINDHTLEAINFLCTNMPDVEWSGTLFYRNSGSIASNDLTLNVVDLFIQDIGTPGSTEFTFNESTVDYAVEKDLMNNDLQMGLIHSHNTMKSYFSTIDDSTLIAEGTDRVHFLSLIVNNAGEYAARLTRKVKVDINYEKVYQYNSFKCEGSYTTKENGNDCLEYIEYFDLNIIKPLPVLNPHHLELLNTINTIKEKKKADSINLESKCNTTGCDVLKYSTNREAVEFKEYPKLKLNPSQALTTVGINTDIPVILLQDICAQILSGSVLASSTNMNIKKLAVDLPNIFSKRFPDITDYNDWIFGHIDYVVIDSSNRLSEVEDEDIIVLLCTKLIDIIQELHSNPYTQTILSYLESYIEYASTEEELDYNNKNLNYEYNIK